LSLATIRCTVPSMLRQLTVSAAPGDAGFGLNDWLPELPVILTVAPDGVGVGVGVGVGDGVPPLYPLPPQAAQATATPKTVARRSWERMVVYL
jgi:hypothetical protein